MSWGKFGVGRVLANTCTRPGSRKGGDREEDMVSWRLSRDFKAVAMVTRQRLLFLNNSHPPLLTRQGGVSHWSWGRGSRFTKTNWQSDRVLIFALIAVAGHFMVAVTLAKASKPSRSSSDERPARQLAQLRHEYPAMQWGCVWQTPI